MPVVGLVGIRHFERNPGGLVSHLMELGLNDKLSMMDPDRSGTQNRIFGYLPGTRFPENGFYKTIMNIAY